jgi:uncharacterized protein (TIGR02145 family)
MFGVAFPASGRRDYSNGLLYNVGAYGVYWSGSAYSGVPRAYYLTFNNGSATLGSYDYRHSGLPVRCVKD